MTDFLEHGKQQLGNTYYSTLLTMLHEKIEEETRCDSKALFLQNNATTYKSHVAMQTTPDLRFKLLESPPSSPDLGPPKYHIFSQLGKVGIIQRRGDRSC